MFRPVRGIVPLCLGLLLLAPWALLPAAEPPRTNLVLVMTDNHAPWTLGCYGNPDIRTPNIDRLAAQGVLFSRCYSAASTSSSPAMPSRNTT